MRSYNGVGPAWARFNEKGTGRSTKQDKRVRFRDSMLISYQTVVARYHTHTVASNGGKTQWQVVLVTSHYYSLSTNSHIRACTHYCNVPVFHVPNIGAAYPLGRLDHAANVAHLWSAVTDIVADAKRRYNTHTWSGQWLEDNWRNELRAAYGKVCEYVNAFALDTIIPATLDYLIADTEKTRGEKRAAYNSPIRVAARLRARARKIAKDAMGIAA